MSIQRLTPRKLALRDRKRRRPEWKHNPANPEMVVCTRVLYENTLGTYTSHEVELSPESMTELAAESLGYAETDLSKPNWDRDPLYHAAKKLRRRRRKARGSGD